MQLINIKNVLSAFILIVSWTSANVFSANEKLLYVHGYTLETQEAYAGAPAGSGLELCTNRTDCSYWDEQLNEDLVHVGWASAKDDWRYTPVLTMVNMLNNHCLASNNQSCAIICHSTGCPIAARALANYGGQYNWSVTRVLSLGSAEGGSDLASYADIAGPFAAANAKYITPSIVRGAYNHNVTRGAQFYHAAGHSGSVQSFLLPGEDDGVVAYHSACGYVEQFSADYCSGDSKLDPVWYNPFRTKKVNQWTNHQRITYCGRGGCNENHSGIRSLEYQQRAFATNP